jgi:hypothetical protein
MDPRGTGPVARLSLVALDCPDPVALAQFYGAVTGWPVGSVEDDWVELDAGGGVTLAFQLAPDHRPPDWPDGERLQQVHLDLEVQDLDLAEREVLALGARAAAVQPDPDAWRVLLDPAGHPFCLVRARNG